MNKLTFMNDSWALPPQDFSAFERVKLGWVHPQVITATTRRVSNCRRRHENLAAVMVPTGHAAEYFLIELRDRPEGGYGSAAPDDYRGLAVYHVLEGSSMWQDPPIVKLEPADGDIVPNSPLDPHDFVYPENPALLRPMAVRSYYGDGDEVFRISNVARGDDGSRVRCHRGAASDGSAARQPPGEPLVRSGRTGWSRRLEHGIVRSQRRDVRVAKRHRVGRHHDRRARIGLRERPVVVADGCAARPGRALPALRCAEGTSDPRRPGERWGECLPARRIHPVRSDLRQLRLDDAVCRFRGRNVVGGRRLSARLLRKHGAGKALV